MKRKIYRLNIRDIEEIVLEYFDDFEEGEEITLRTQIYISECECGDKTHLFIFDVKQVLPD